MIKKLLIVLLQQLRALLVPIAKQALKIISNLVKKVARLEVILNITNFFKNDYNINQYGAKKLKFFYYFYGIAKTNIKRGEFKFILKFRTIINYFINSLGSSISEEYLRELFKELIESGWIVRTRQKKKDKWIWVITLNYAFVDAIKAQALLFDLKDKKAPKKLYSWFSWLFKASRVLKDDPKASFETARKYKLKPILDWFDKSD